MTHEVTKNPTPGSEGTSPEETSTLPRAASIPVSPTRAGVPEDPDVQDA